MANEKRKSMEMDVDDEETEISSYWGNDGDKDNDNCDNATTTNSVTACSGSECEESEAKQEFECVSVIEPPVLVPPPTQSLRTSIGENNELNESENDTEMEMDGNENETGHSQLKLKRDHTAKAETNAKGIKHIDRNVVHQICSGQVIVTLSTAVKELVENAIDAGAKSVEIRLTEYGSEVIEVIDNGSGVHETNFEGLALKHHTSKISEFEDLTTISTFGFRGEALSSLCALSNLTVITRSRSEAPGSKTGFKLEYDSTGKLIAKTACAREYGTTVILKNIFTPLPVRHREFLKNLKREFHKMVNVLYGYCLIAQGVRITCTHQQGSGSFSKIVSVPSTLGLRERILALFGSKQINSLLEFQQEDIISEESLAEFGLTRQTFINDKYSIEGYLSKPNQGRSSNDRQFFFINSRPCDISKISKIVNEVYHLYSRNQCPFVCLNVKTGQENVDVNVTPDKRLLYLKSEKSLYALLKASLTSIYTLDSSSFDTSQSQSSIKESFSQSQSGFSVSQKSEKTFKESTLGSTSIQKFGIGNENTFASQFSTNPRSLRESQSSRSTRSTSLLQRFSRTASKIMGQGKGQALETTGFSSSTSASSKKARLDPFRRSVSESTPISTLLGFVPQSSNSILIEDKGIEDNDVTFIEILKSGVQTETHNDQDMLVNSCDTYSSSFRLSQDSYSYSETNDSQIENIRVMYDDEFDEEFSERKSIPLKVDWEVVKANINKWKDKSQDEKIYSRKFRAKISPGENDVAERELRKQLSKDMFKQMQIIGQFNLGFVLVKSGPDLFIVDQHASDEKYNFENLEKTTVLQTQKLIS